MESLLGVLICLSPLLFVLFGYYVGRYGSPIVIRFQRPHDRREALADGDDEPETVVYRQEQTS
jgi:hypothetical protein